MDLYDVLLQLGVFTYEDLFTGKGITTPDQVKNLSRADARDILPADQVENFWKQHQKLFPDKHVSQSSVENSPGENQNTQKSTVSPINQNNAALRRPLDRIDLNQVNHRVQNNCQRPVDPAADNQVNNVIGAVTNPTEENPVNSIFVTENLDISKILDGSFEGKNLVEYYSKNHRLLNPHRTKLVHIIICAVLRQCKRDLGDQDFIILRRKILEIFPKETGCVYYSPPVSQKTSNTGKSERASGRLLHKYRNLKRMPIGVFSAPRPIDNEQNDDDEALVATEDEQISLEWLRSLEEPWETTKRHWEKTYRFRNSNADEVEPNKLVRSVFEDWTILKSSKGYELIEIDFTLSGLCAVEKPMQNFSDLFWRVYDKRSIPNDELCKKLMDLEKEDDRPVESKIFIQLILLSFMFAPTIRIPQGDKKVWKPSCLESVEGIITHVKDYKDIEAVKEDRRIFATSKHITLQPYIIAVGDEDYEVDKCYVIIDDNEYQLSTLSEAIDICFKAFHVLHAKYQIQSMHLWLILQHGLYRFRTRWDPHPITFKVDELMKDICLPLREWQASAA